MLPGGRRPGDEESADRCLRCDDRAAWQESGGADVLAGVSMPVLIWQDIPHVR